MAIATKKKPSLIGKAYFTSGCDSRQEVYDKFEWEQYVNSTSRLQKKTQRVSSCSCRNA